MSESNRRLVAAFIAVTFFGIGAGTTTLIHARNEHEKVVAAHAPASGKATSAQQSAIERAGLPDALETYISNPEPADKTEAEKRDLAAQEAAAVGSLWAAMFAAIGLAITGAGTFLLYQQIVLTRKAVEDTGEATEAMREQNRIAREAQRPWLDINVIEDHPGKLNSSSFTVYLSIHVKNIGHSPANIVDIRTRHRKPSTTLHDNETDFTIHSLEDDDFFSFKNRGNTKNILPSGEDISIFAETVALEECFVRHTAQFSGVFFALDVVVSYTWHNAEHHSAATFQVFASDPPPFQRAVRRPTLEIRDVQAIPSVLDRKHT